MSPIKQANDRDLTASDITALENSSQVTHFFAYLGYDVDKAAEMEPAAMDLATGDLPYQIEHFYKIADTDANQEVQVFLFKLFEKRSITVKLIQDLVRVFRKFSDLFVPVLTNDYDEFHFVLLDRPKDSATEANQSSLVSKVTPVSAIRPRMLTFKRTAPGIVALRVLKRFTNTESDGLYQWDKLRSAYSLAEWSEPEFNNRALFSDYYLKNRLTDKTLNPSWEEDVRRAAGSAMDLIAGARASLTGKGEQKNRKDLIEPLLALLGFNVIAGRQDGTVIDQPDYTLYASNDTNSPLAQVLAYRWERNLDAIDT